MTGQILQDQLAPKLTIPNDYRAEFWDIFRSKTTPSFQDDWTNFSRVSSFRNLVYKITTELTFEEHSLFETISSSWTRFSKVSSRQNSTYKISIEPTCEEKVFKEKVIKENFPQKSWPWHNAGRRSVFEAPWVWKDFQNARNFQNTKFSFTCTVERSHKSRKYWLTKFEQLFSKKNHDSKAPTWTSKKSRDCWKFLGFFESNRVEPFSQIYLNYSNITWKRFLILKSHCVLKIFSKPSCIKNSPATGVKEKFRGKCSRKNFLTKVRFDIKSNFPQKCWPRYTRRT